MGSTLLERFKATIEHKNNDGPLFYINFVKPVEEYIRRTLRIAEDINLAEYFEIPEPIDVCIPLVDENTVSDFSAYYQDIDITKNAKIDVLGVLHVSGSQHHFTHRISPLRNATSFDELEKFTYPSRKIETSQIKDSVEQAHRAGIHTTFFVGHIYEYSWQIRGYEQFLMDMVTQKEWCHYILNRFTEMAVNRAIIAAEAGIDMIKTGDDVANQQNLMFSLPQWREFIKPCWEKIFSAVKRINPNIQIWYHSDGNIEQIVDELIEIGVTVLNPVQPECVDIIKLKKEFGKKLVFDGTIGTQTTMPFGSTQDVREAIRSRVELFSDEGALILAPTHVIEPDVPLDNILAFVDEARKAYK